MADLYLLLVFFFFSLSAVVVGDEAAKAEWETFSLRTFVNRWLALTAVGAALLLISAARLQVGETHLNVKAVALLVPALMTLGHQARAGYCSEKKERWQKKYTHVR